MDAEPRVYSDTASRVSAYPRLGQNIHLRKVMRRVGRKFEICKGSAEDLQCWVKLRASALR